MKDIDEAIQHCLKVAHKKTKEAKERRIDPDSVGSKTFLYDWEVRKANQKAAECEECAAEHRQLAEWLKDYKRLLAKESGVDIRCGNCKHDEDGSGICDECLEYSKWEAME